MNAYKLEFDGSLLERGFWLYIWKITYRKRCLFYVGRTGDSSSKYAASPFNRLGQHLDIRPTATANTLLRNILKEGYEPLKCKFELVSLGPFFPEQKTLKTHRKYRDIIAPLESALADYLKEEGLRVIGRHPKPKPKDEKLFKQVIYTIKKKHPDLVNL